VQFFSDVWCLEKELSLDAKKRTPPIGIVSGHVRPGELNEFIDGDLGFLGEGLKSWPILVGTNHHLWPMRRDRGKSLTRESGI
jgi:hypothetical protein